MNVSQLETVGEKIEALGGMKDTKARRVLNTAPDQKANITAKEIEEGGITIEMLEALNVPVYTYSTQATIHGIVEGVYSGYDALRYKSIIRNGNGSTGVKYIAIDAKKKNHIHRMINAWYSEHKAFIQISSQAFIIARGYGSFESHQKAEYLEAIDKARKDLEAMPKCFFGSAKVAQTNNYGLLSVYLIAELGAIYQNDMETITQWWTGHSDEETEKHIIEAKEQQKRDQEAYAKRVDEERKEGEAKKAEAQAKLLDSVKDNPPTGYQGEGTYTYKLIQWTSMTEYHVKEGTMIFTKGSKGMNVTTGVTGEKTKTYAFDKVEEVFKKSPRLLWKQEETEQETPKGNKPTVTHNTEKGGIEIRFSGKPTKAVLDSLKANGWRWSNFQGVWYTKYSQKALDFANQIVA